MKPTPNDTKAKQFFTAVAMTILFALGLALIVALYYWSTLLNASAVRWMQICGNLVFAAFVVSSIVFVLVTALSMLDWMRATCHPPTEQPAHNNDGQLLTH